MILSRVVHIWLVSRTASKAETQASYPSTASTVVCLSGINYVHPLPQWTV